MKEVFENSELSGFSKFSLEHCMQHIDIFIHTLPNILDLVGIAI